MVEVTNSANSYDTNIKFLLADKQFLINLEAQKSSDPGKLRYHLDLISREVEVVTIMMSLFDDEQIMRTYLKDATNTAAYEAERMIKKGKMSLEDIADCVPTLSFEELKKIEAKVTQLA